MDGNGLTRIAFMYPTETTNKKWLFRIPGVICPECVGDFHPFFHGNHWVRRLQLGNGSPFCFIVGFLRGEVQGEGVTGEP